VGEDRKPQEELPAAPRLPERAAIYIAPDGSVHFGALFEGLVPVAAALGGKTVQSQVTNRGSQPRPLVGIGSRGSDIAGGSGE
jgi:hypothetical protein